MAENQTLEVTEPKPFGFTVLPEGSERITEDEYERLPDYVQDLINESADGKLPETSHEQLVAASTAYFENSVTAVVEQEPAVEEVKESENEHDRGHSAGAGGAVHPSE